MLKITSSDIIPWGLLSFAILRVTMTWFVCDDQERGGLFGTI